MPSRTVCPSITNANQKLKGEATPDDHDTVALISIAKHILEFIAGKCGHAIYTLGPNHIFAADNERAFLLEYNPDSMLAAVYRAINYNRLPVDAALSTTLCSMA